eukprot:scaffold24_cov128-Cylindrotheca_fusiformis.AAC.7
MSALNGSNGTTSDDKVQQDLDLFLTTVESKLRGPFSSLDLAKAVTTTALRGSLSPPEYLQNLNKVLLRTDKVSQLRILIGLLGLEPDPKIDEQVVAILETAQNKSDEPWVQTIAGLIQGILFKDEHDSSRKSCRGKVAEELLTKTCNDICDRVLKAYQSSKTEDNDCPPDLNAYFVPYRYSLVPTEMLEKTKIYEHTNPHFQVNEEATILKIDEELEAQRAKEAQEHAPLPYRLGGTAATAQTASDSAARGNLPPGFKPTNLVSKVKPKKPSSSMFVTRPNPAAKKAQLANNRGAKLMRRKGGAQSLVSGTKFKNRTGGTAAPIAATKTTTTTTTSPSSKLLAGSGTATAGAKAIQRGRFSSGKSKMKMIDVDTVSSLHQQTMQRKEEETMSKASKKRRIMEAAKQQGLKKTKVEKETTPQQEEQQQQQQMESKEDPPLEASTQPGAPAPPQQQQQQQQPEHEWKVLLRERSNKLSDSDRLRAQQFFENQYNPTPEQPVYKMKLHEQRTVDPATGGEIKETFYLELDYEQNTSKQSKKIKRY